MTEPRTHRFRFERYGKRQRMLTPALGDALEDPLILTIRQTSASACTAKYFRTFCSCRKRIHRSGCRRRDCPLCAEDLTSRRSIRIFKRFEQVRKGRPILYTVFTLPVALRGKYTSRTEWRNLVKNLIAELKSTAGLELGCEQSHPVGDSEEHFHPHVNILWIQKKGHHADFNVRRLRQMWKWLLDYSDGDVVVHHQWTRRDAVNKQSGEQISINVQIKHLCNYVARTFPGYSSWVGSIRWYGKIPKLPDETHVCPHCGSVYVFDGFSDEDEYLEDRARRIQDD